MIRNYIKTAYRSLIKNKAYSFLNIFGLAIGIACAALIFLWVEDEVNFDAVNIKKDRLYMVEENQQYDTYVFTESSTPGLMGPAMNTELPGVANTCRSTEGGTTLLFGNGDKAVFATGIYAEPSLFSMFTLPFVQGNATSVFSQVHSIVITEKTAKKFFGNDKDVIGKTIRVDNKQDYAVSGVIKDIPANSSMQFEWVMPFKIYFDQSPWLTSWGNQSVTTYVELKPGVNPQTVNKQLYSYIQKRVPTALGHAFLFSMNDWHLRDDFKEGKMTGGGQIEYVHLFTVIAWIILFIACINFMNLATARSEKRAREVGVRKVLGAGKNLLIMQFIGEAIFMAVIAALVSVFIIILVLPAFNILVQKQLTLGLGNPMHIISLLLITLICGLVAGSYPSFYLSSFNPVSVLKGVKLKTGGAAFIRKGLVVMQFSVSIVLIISTIIVYQQIQHVKSRQLGFNKDNLIEIPLQGDMGKNFNVIKQDLLSTNYIANAALADHSLIYGGNNTSGLTWDGKPATSKVLISQRYVSPEFMETTGLKVLEGRNLTVSDTARPIRMIITQSLAKLMGKGNAIGKRIHGEQDTTSAVVVGVVNDYVYGNMYNKQPDPVMFFSAPPQDETVMYVHVKQQADIEKAIAAIQGVLKKDNPAYPFDYRFVDDQFNQMFLTEMLVSKLSRVFATLAIIISCMGLFGLAAYTAERRTKEIGIRKVLGASVSGIATLLSKDFLQLVIISCVVSFPFAYWVMQKWLKGYDYRIGINWWVFVIAGVSAIIIAVVTVSFQSIKAAIANPVKSLRSE
ncbi:ABC transporter permease [Mucilaginibacter sp. X5P1]|uniref:ABC transporter permease n=1 Tax=Mucilaginibacter sp. X5P1 TaxID=2723088 RepID=UPI001612B681|nr:ABC transporter permease [Mucilaginibacter sp. X5P1]MBB6138452.1 putative permease [Mucilaginibacter sp. X5P1]